MKTYLVKTPVPGVTGQNAGVYFDKGEAKVTVDIAAGTEDNATLSAMRYFVEAGYWISELDGEPVDQDRLASELGLPAPANRETAALSREADALKARRDQLKSVEDIDALRKEVADLEKAAADRAAKQAEDDAKAAADAQAEADKIKAEDEAKANPDAKISTKSTAKGGDKNG